MSSITPNDLTLGFVMLTVVISALALYFQIADHRYQQVRQLRIDAKADISTGNVNIELLNPASHRFILSSLTIAYGVTAADAKTLLAGDGLPRELKEAEPFRTSIDRATLVAAGQEKRIEKVHYGVLWLKVGATMGKPLSREVGFFSNGKPCEPSESWLRASAFLGFPTPETSPPRRGYVELQWK